MKSLKYLYRKTLVVCLQNRLAACNCTVDSFSLFLSRRIDQLDAAEIRGKGN